MVAGSKFVTAQRQQALRTQELTTEIDIWFKRLDSEKPLSGKEAVRLQNLLISLKSKLKAEV